MSNISQLFTAYATVIGFGSYLALRLIDMPLLVSISGGCAATVAVAALLAV